MNEASTYGGGVDANGNTFTIEQSEVYSNGVTAKSGQGGGLMLRSKDSNVVTSTNIIANGSAGNGGGFSAWSPFTLSGGQVRANYAEFQGGGAYIETGNNNAKSTWDGCKVENNESNDRGGGFYLFTGKLDFTNPTSFTGNKATNGFAGGAYEPVDAVTWAGLPVGSQKIEKVP